LLGAGPQFIAVELAIPVGVERHEPLQEPLRHRSLAATARSRPISSFGASRTSGPPLPPRTARAFRTVLSTSALRRTAIDATAIAIRPTRRHLWPDLIVPQDSVAVAVERQQRVGGAPDLVCVELMIVIGIESLANRIGRWTKSARRRSWATTGRPFESPGRLGSGGSRHSHRCHCRHGVRPS
jgi:hypothetical protein